VRISRPTQQATTVDDVTFRGHAIAFLYIGDKTSHLNYISGELVTNNKGRFAPPLGPRIPIVDVHVSAAHSGAAYANKDFVLADTRLRDILELETG
jgi:hypothetical protein